MLCTGFGLFELSHKSAKIWQDRKLHGKRGINMQIIQTKLRKIFENKRKLSITKKRTDIHILLYGCFVCFNVGIDVKSINQSIN